MKLLSITEGNLDDDLVQQLFAILLFQIGYLQGEFSALVIQSQFDESTARIFRSLQKNTSVKNRDTISTGQNATKFARKVYKSALQELHCVSKTA